MFTVNFVYSLNSERHDALLKASEQSLVTMRSYEIRKRRMTV